MLAARWESQTGRAGVRTVLERYRYAIYNLGDHLLCSLIFLSGRRRRISVQHHAVCKDRYRKRLEIFRRAKATAIEKGRSLGRPVEHLRATRRHSQREVLRVAGLTDNSKRIVDQRIIDANLRNWLLHFQDIGAVQHRFHYVQLARADF